MVEAKKPTKAQVFEHKIVLARDKWGRLTALKDKDSVRGFPLSTGTSNQRTRAIESGYDKYRYDSEGKLVGVPSVKEEVKEYGKELDRTLRIPKYHTVEQDGYIWVWTGKDAPESDPLDIPSVSDYIWNQQTLHIDADPNLCIQLEMDWPSSLPQGRLAWAHRRSLIATQKNMTLDQHFEARSTEHGFEIFQPPTSSITDSKLRQARSTAFYLPDRVIHQKLLKRKFWRGFGDFMSIAHFVPIVDPITGKVTTRAEYMWTPIILPGYAFQRNKLTTWPEWMSSLIFSDRIRDKHTLETLQANLNHWNAVDALDTHPHFMEIEDGPLTAPASSSSPSQALTIGAKPAFGSEINFDSPSQAVSNIIQLATSGLWNQENAHIIIPSGRHVGKFRVTNPDS
jgi:nitrite reductase/ring-hydroxylating ferredoxin subunit